MAMKKKRLGDGSAFKKVERAAAAHGAKDPAAVAAVAGRKKLGKEKFQKLAAAGKKRHEKKSLGEARAITAHADNDSSAVKKSRKKEPALARYKGGSCIDLSGGY